MATFSCVAQKAASAAHRQKIYKNKNNVIVKMRIRGEGSSGQRENGKIIPQLGRGTTLILEQICFKMPTLFCCRLLRIHPFPPPPPSAQASTAGMCSILAFSVVHRQHFDADPDRTFNFQCRPPIRITILS